LVFQGSVQRMGEEEQKRGKDDENQEKARGLKSY
jgi:hypothetical protein